jgi:uncharacterized membrane protein
LLPAGILFLHNLFTIVWIGGMISLGLIILPVTSKTLGRGPQAKDLIERIQNKLSRFVWVSMVGLLVSGILLSKRRTAFGGLFSFENTYSAVLSVKHIAVGLMIALVAARRWLVKQTTSRDQRPFKVASLVVLYANMALGLMVLFLSAMNAMLGGH